MVDVPAVLVVLVPQVQVVAETAETPQLLLVAQFPRVQVVEEVVKKTLVKSRLEMLAEIDCDEGHELILQGNDSVSVAKDVEYKTNEVSEKSPDCMVCSSASGSKRQRHNCNQQHGPRQAVQQTVQERRVERGKEKQKRKRKMLGRKGRRKRERKLDGKEERRGTEGERVERKEEKEREVEKNVTGWTLVTRSAKQVKRIVQIFVKVDEMKNGCDGGLARRQVQILNTVSGSDWDVYVMSEGILRKCDELKRREHSAGHEQDARWRKTQGQEG